MQVLHVQLFILAAVVAALVRGHAVEKEQPASHAYGPPIHISSGVLQLAPDTEQPHLLLVPSSYSTSLGNPWPHFYVDTLTASHLPHSVIPSIPSIHEPRIVVNDNVDFSQLKLPQHQVVHSHGR
ncbi:GD17336 [Drosophila simulans]|uniref:GD17336 n=2 Tax=Drosophila simulans TaxID=7240 RepID=B4R6E1_DROSI|nr:GD17336 [Drosophila simulans]